MMFDNIKNSIRKWEKAVNALEVFKKEIVKSDVDLFIETTENMEESFKQNTVALDDKIRELRKVKREIKAIERQKTDLKRMIINRSHLLDAKTISYFEPEAISPTTITPKYSYSLSMEVQMREGKIRIWSAQLHKEYTSSSRIIDLDYGLFCDIPDAEITKIAIKRGRNNFKKFNNFFRLERTDNKYLCPELLEAKRKLKEQDQETKLEKAISERKELNKKIKELRKGER